MLKKKSTYKDHQTFKNKYLNLLYKNKLFVQTTKLLEIMLQEKKIFPNQRIMNSLIDNEFALFFKLK